MRRHEPHAGDAMVPTGLPRIPVLHAEDLPGGDDWTLLTTLRVDRDESFEHELQYDRYGSLMLAPAAFD